MMETRRATQIAHARSALPRPGLAARHPQALYRPLPPVDCDDDGYPFSDGKPVESTAHDRTAAYLGSVMRTRYRRQADVCVACDLGLYFERGNRTAVLSPDFMIAFGVDGRADRLSYKVWDEGRVPDLALEILSVHTWRRNLAIKPGLYRDLGVREYWTVEVLGRISPPIIGRRLVDGDYADIPADASGGCRSEVLGLDLAMVDGEFRFRESDTGEIVPDYAQIEDMRRAESEARQAESEARQAAEARIAVLEAEIRQLRK